MSSRANTENRRPAGGLARAVLLLPAVLAISCAVARDATVDEGDGAFVDAPPGGPSAGRDASPPAPEGEPDSASGLRVTVSASARRVCGGGCVSLTAEAAGGQTPYAYTWSPVLRTGAGPHRVCPARTTTYAVEVSDATLASDEFAADPVSATIEIVVGDACGDGGAGDADTQLPPDQQPDRDPDAVGVEARELHEACRARAALTPSSAMWTNAPSLAGYPHVTTLAVDAGGNFTVATGFEGLFDVGGAVLDAKGGQYGLLVSKYDASCARLWSKSYGGAFSAVEGASVAVAGSELVLAGMFSGAIDFGRGALISPANVGAMLVKLDAQGNTLWSRAFIGSSSARFYDVAVDDAGDIVVTGLFYGAGSLGGAMLGDAQAGAAVPFVAKFSPDGTHVWSHVVDGGAYSEIRVAVLPDRSIVLAGISNLAAMVTKLDSGGGGMLWGYGEPQLESRYFANQLGLEPSADGGIAVAYQLAGGDPQLALTRRDAEGQIESNVSFTRLNQDFHAAALAIDASGDAFEAGAFVETLDRTTLTSAGDSDVFLLQHDASGATIGYASVGTASIDWPLALAADGDDQVVLAVVTEIAPFTADLTLIRYAP